MAIDDASTALAPAASLSDPPVLTGMKRFPRGLVAGLAHCIEDGAAGDRCSRRRPATAAGPPDAITATSHP